MLRTFHRNRTGILPAALLLFGILVSPIAVKAEPAPGKLLLKARHVFDGSSIHENAAVLIEQGRVLELGPQASVKPGGARVLDLGDATLLPGIIELHAHLTYRHVPEDVVLRHGVTTVRDVGGPLHPPRGGDGRLRVLTSGPILTAPQGYPIVLMGAERIATAVADEEEARQAVRDLAKGGAVVIKVALEPGGEAGAPWSGGHHHPAHSGHKHGHAPGPSHGESSDPGNWPLLPEAVVRAIVEEAHRHDLKVTAHIGEEQGARLAVTAGVDEWAHMPCGPITGRVRKLAAEQGVKIVSTLDTLSQCAGARSNAKVWATFEGETLYGSEIAHPDVPWGVNAQELLYLMPLFEGDPFRVLQSATSKAGAQLGIPLLGTLKPGAPADLIAVKGGVAHNLKKLEYPALVISGGTVVVNRFE